MACRSKTGTPVNEGMGLRTLVGDAGWARLAPAIRTRFNAEPAEGEMRTYRGSVDVVATTKIGRMIAWAARLIGAPMAWATGRHVPCEVRVYRDREAGIVWERRYDFGGGNVQVARTTKRSDGNGRLLECFGAGAGMTLDVFEQDKALHFVSEDFFIGLGRWKLRFPLLLSPGTLHVTQKDEGGGAFRFSMLVNHPLLGCVAEQDGVFREMET